MTRTGTTSDIDDLLELSVRLPSHCLPGSSVLIDRRAAIRSETGLSNSLQRYHIDNIEGAKTAETRARRIDKAIGLFVAGKAR